MAVTSIDIEPGLLRDVKELLGASSNKDAVIESLQFTARMARQALAAERIASREFTDDQINAPKIDYAE
ncbi:hypothetical protein [Glaciihabitans sp. UYNi722]|uniref:hypothetical protein n=1 Tax=Glaciihabitans sp. UYNi722 TaxID=3156344 RepID=UPI003390EA27